MMRNLMSHVRNYRIPVLGSVISLIIAAFCSLLQPWLLQDTLNCLMKNDAAGIKRYGIFLLLLAAIGVVCGILNIWFAAKTAQGVTSDVREQLYRKIQSFSFSNIEKFSVGTLIVRLINDMNQVTNIIMTTLMQVLRMPIILIGSFVMGIVTLPRYWWVQILLLLIVSLVLFFVFPSLDKLFSKYQVWFDECNTVARESMQGVRVVKSFNQQDQETEKFTASSNELNQLNIKIGYVFSILMPAFTLVVCIGTALIVYLVGKNIGLYPKDISAISSYVGYLSQMLSNLAFGGMMLAQYSRGLVSLKRIDEVIETEPDLKFNHEESNVDLKGSVEFDDVSFKYPGSSKETLSHVSFKVDPGETVGIVGKTGSGKSTLVSLLVRLYDPTSGTIRLGGCDLRDVNERKLRKMAALVQQKALLFSGTIADNLRQGDEDATEEDMERAIEISQAKEFIDKYPDRFEHVVEERSANFSGGQQQRLSIARGIIGKPKVLILDDSTSALDAESEKKVQAGLEQKLGDATVFIIAEKIFSVMHADKILVMDDGKIKAMGTHEELLLTSPLYQEIYETQRAGEGGI
ncbi:ATP-binding cassette domain-containing protein [Lactobacillus ruminis]|uniref:ATP-binding cassette domain-containing protein n=2 Tax=Ligilactobacillus ruminis TaxID=1623 RepID=A0A6A8GVB4_9LACO|nr:ABC transporter ATP-binding protein [Ligilactobacillus ruminis]MSA21085.1 ATP-binding cassette domain-containing protein [Ligilactobacillus ruminis]MSA23132.1 ATP-binding cassette domain-containing protein [Ligilactobacillus ruminis]MSA24916.1 ATP-binding cassette domain-containing protein [Ligilactobacillus ruminis]MSA35169.1 ATP-binding cassette domain-containing protein [Ligilactobacillus ruminis]